MADWRQVTGVWIVGFQNGTEIVVAVLVQAGGFGAEAAAPIAKDVVKAYYDKKRGTAPEHQLLLSAGVSPLEPVAAKPVKQTVKASVAPPEEALPDDPEPVPAVAKQAVNP